MDIEQIPHVMEWARKHIWLAVIAGMFGIFIYGSYAFVGGYATKFGESFASYNSFKHSIASYTVIDTIMHNYLVKYNASRISVARFHNSVHDVGNNALFFITFENTIAAPGVTLDISQIDTPANIYSVILPSLLDQKPVFVFTKDLPDNTFKETLVKNGVRAAFFVPVRDLSDRLIGMLFVSWISEGDIPKEDQRPAMINDLTEVASRVGAYFSAKE